LFDRAIGMRRTVMQDRSCASEKKRYIFLLRDDLNDRIVRSGGGSEAALKTE
jgi:hypothetical protein